MIRRPLPQLRPQRPAVRVTGIQERSYPGKTPIDFLPPLRPCRTHRSSLLRLYFLTPEMIYHKRRWQRAGIPAFSANGRTTEDYLTIVMAVDRVHKILIEHGSLVRNIGIFGLATMHKSGSDGPFSHFSLWKDIFQIFFFLSGKTSLSKSRRGTWLEEWTYKKFQRTH